VGGDRLRQHDGGLAGRHAAAALADVDFDEDVEQGLRSAGSPPLDSRREPGNALQAVHRNRQPAARRLQALRQRGHPLQLGRVDDLVADVDVGHAGRGQRLGLRGLLHAHAHGASLHLQPCEKGALVHLGVRAKPHPVGARKCGHARQVELHRVEIDHCRGSVDGGHALACQGSQRGGQRRMGLRWCFHRATRFPGGRCPTSRPA
jgi:hypothetical protein